MGGDTYLHAVRRTDNHISIPRYTPHMTQEFPDAGDGRTYPGDPILFQRPYHIRPEVIIGKQAGHLMAAFCEAKRKLEQSTIAICEDILAHVVALENEQEVEWRRQTGAQLSASINFLAIIRLFATTWCIS